MRTGLYLAVGALLGALVTLLLAARGATPWGEAALIGLPLGFVLGSICLAARFPARSAPLGHGAAVRVAATHATAAVVSIASWVLAGALLAWFLDRVPAHAGASARFNAEAPELFIVGVLIFMLAVAVHYLVIALETAREAQVRGVQARVLAREAELRALRAQVDPHFLFNSLNSIAALTADDSAAARRMCLQLAGFLRRSLALGAQERIPLGEELGLVHDYLAIEKVRFGARLTVEERIDDTCLEGLVPPFLLQPLVENAVRHGIAQLVEGGTIRIEARRERGLVTVAVENPRDPEKNGGRGAGLGLDNVRGRLLALFGDEARVDVETAPARDRVALTLPYVPGVGGAQAARRAGGEP
jgi:hypothetical protein